MKSNGGHEGKAKREGVEVKQRGKQREREQWLAEPREGEGRRGDEKVGERGEEEDGRKKETEEPW